MSDTANGWRDIASAPKDGTKFLADTCDYQFGMSFNRKVQEARWIGSSPDDPAGGFCSDNGQIINGWQPLPPAPEKPA